MDAPIIVEKRCSNCRLLKAATREFFSPNIAGQFQLSSWCKQCANAAARLRRERNRLPPETVEQRFWRHVDKRGVGECWPWRGSVFRHGGYGRFWAGKERGIWWLAHRFSWELHNGPILDAATCVLHRCDNPPCVNPGHLFLGTQLDNLVDMQRKNRGVKPPVRLGVDHHMTRFSEEEILVIRARASAGENYAAIGRSFGTGGNTISRIVRRITWGHLQ